MANMLESIKTADYIPIILQGGEQADEAMYYLLHQRLHGQLWRHFDSYRTHLNDDFDDMLDDFFLYLREGKDGKNTTPYQSLQSIRIKDSFEAWLLSTFRNYVSIRTAKEDKVVFTSLSVDITASLETPASPLTDERKLSIVSNLIAYAYQTLLPRSRFIFLRSLLSMLQKHKALPNEEVAQALGMTSISYRVMVHRLKRNLAKYREQLSNGEKLALDEQHRKMAQHINDDFLNLYPTLLLYYNQNVDTLDCAEDIKKLRKKHYEATGDMLHEAEVEYSVKLTITAFMNQLDAFLRT